MFTPPLVGTSMPDRMFSSVDLPQPDGPTTETNECPLMLRFTFSSATTLSAPRPNSLCSLSIVMSAMDVSLPQSSGGSSSSSSTVCGRPDVTIVMLPIAAPVAVDAAAAAPMDALVGASNCCSTTSTSSSDGRHLKS